MESTYGRIDDFIASLCVIATCFSLHHGFADHFGCDEATTGHLGYRTILNAIRCGGMGAWAALTVNLE